MKAGDFKTVIRSTASSIAEPNRQFDVLLTDSRHLALAERSIFFAIPTKRNSGFRYVEELYADGVRNFVVSNELTAADREVLAKMPKANIWEVGDVVTALQETATYKRTLFDIPVVGITGSNGKTVVKDWLSQMVSIDRKTVSSPMSYNSQIGVPLSVWHLAANTEIAFFETGISQPGEMERLQKIVRPTIGLITNIGQAHDENFLSREHKINEKIRLFTQCEAIIFCADHQEIRSALIENQALHHIRRFTWSQNSQSDVLLTSIKASQQQSIVPCSHSQSVLTVRYNGEEQEITIPFNDRAAIEDAMHCITVMLYLGYNLPTIADRCQMLQPVEMRLEQNEGINNCQIINDGYSLDLESLEIALEVMQHDTHHQSKTLVMSDFIQTGLTPETLYQEVAKRIQSRGVEHFVGIGEELCKRKACFDGINATFYPTVDEFLHRHPISSFNNETILLKGARQFHFENIAKVLQRKSHETVLEVSLEAMMQNLNYYRSMLQPTTKLMAMVKANSYGSGKAEIANLLQYNHVDYLTVAYTDEGVDLRRAGITLPIMVMNPEEQSFDDIIQYNLEPDIYSFRILDLFNNTVRMFRPNGPKVRIHIEFDTGMHRLGFGEADIDELAARLLYDGCMLQPCSIFSHLACSEDPAMDSFTHKQIERFKNWSGQLKTLLGDSSIMCHILNSSGICRFTEAQMDMVRLGIGLYGYAPDSATQAHLTPVSRLKTRVSQIKEIPAGDPVGYNCRWVAERDSRIAIIPIGYADGLHRSLGNGHGMVRIADAYAPIVGVICMDMCFVDVTGIHCEEGDEVVVFGDAKQMEQIAKAAGTINYEILTAVSPRVKRIYYR